MIKKILYSYLKIKDKVMTILKKQGFDMADNRCIIIEELNLRAKEIFKLNTRNSWSVINCLC